MGQSASRLQVVVANLPQARPKLLDRVRAAIRTRHYSIRTEEAYVGWIRRFILFHNKRHPAEMGEAEINQFFTCLAVDDKVAASTQNQALSAILFLYQAVLEKELDRLDGVVRAKKPARLPVVLSRDEVRKILGYMPSAPKLVALLLYGAGLRLLEALRLRVKDIDLAMNQITCGMARGKRIVSRCCRARPRRFWRTTKNTPGKFISRTSSRGLGVCTCPTRWSGNTRLPIESGVGSMCSLPITSRSIRVRAPSDATTWMSP
jgi:integrase